MALRDYCAMYALNVLFPKKVTTFQMDAQGENYILNTCDWPSNLMDNRFGLSNLEKDFAFNRKS